MSVENKGTVTQTPVYVPYATFISALENLRTHGIPGTGKIDKTIWDSQSGAIQGQLVIGFRFLGLIDDHNLVLPPLPLLVKATAEERKPLLKKIIEDKYRDVLALDLATVSAGQLDDAFRRFNISGSTLVRATRFFVKACSEVGIEISKRVSQKTRGPSGPRQRGKTKNGVRHDEMPQEEEPNQMQPRSAWEEKLLEKFPAFDPGWSDDLKAKWFEGFERLMGAK